MLPFIIGEDNTNLKRMIINKYMSDSPIVSIIIKGELGNQLFQIEVAHSYAKKEGDTLQIFHKIDNADRPVYWETILHRVNPRIVSIDIKGGLGNQLFQIAAAYAYAKKEGGILQILYKEYNGVRPVYWETILHRIKPYLVQSVPLDMIHCDESLPTMYQPIPPLTSQGLLLDGYRQTSKYFYNDEIKCNIRKLFTPSSTLMNEVSTRYSFLLENKYRVVVVHARRTDYLRNQTMIDIHGPLPSSYYKEAIQRMKKKVKDPIWLLTSDDNRYWLEIEQELGIHAPIILMNESDIHTFALLQQFQHMIMSNSTFIWWCTWMADARHVIAPSKWFGPAGPHSYDDIYEDHWERI
jgi:hypothetical protein